MKRECSNSDTCKHIKCDCGHCKDFHIYKWECQQINRETLQSCKCKKYSLINNKQNGLV